MRKLLLALILLPVTISAQNNTNILLNNWPGNFGGLPPFDQIKISDFKSALEKGMEMNLAEMDAIANNSEAPTFENTIVQIEKSGLVLERVRTIYELWGSNMSSTEFQVIETEMEPKLAGLSDKIFQNEKLFKRIETIRTVRINH
jgi:peptidyl-dipeptidase Dcp